VPRRLTPAHERYAYDQSEPPGPVTCAIYLFVVLFMLVVVVYILFRTGVI
jgi:hypothetical protein